jgi:hypothetical protein
LKTSKPKNQNSQNLLSLCKCQKSEHLPLVYMQLVSFCNEDNTEGRDSDGFVTVVRPSQRRKSRSPKKGDSVASGGEDFPALESPQKKTSPPQGEDFPALESPPKKGPPTGSKKEWGAGKEGTEVEHDNCKQSSREGGAKSAGISEQADPKPSNPGKPRGHVNASALPALTAEFDGLMTELLTGLRLQAPEQGPSQPLSASPQTKGPVPNKVTAQAQQKVVTSSTPSKDCPVVSTGRALPNWAPLSRALFPSPQTLTKPAAKPTSAKGPKPPAKIMPSPLNGKTQNPVFSTSPLQTPNPLARELSFFALPPRTPNPAAPETPNPFSPKSVLDLSSPVGSPSAIQTPPARRSPYRPAMTADPKKVIGWKPEAQGRPSEVVTSSPFSYSLWGSSGQSLTSAPDTPTRPEAHVLRESPCNVVKEANPSRVSQASRLGAWLGKERPGLLETESEFHQALLRGAFMQPTPFGQPATGAETGPEEDEAFCKICFERESNSAYLCGHTLCGDCAEYIHVHKKVCPFCAQPIETVMRIFA